MSEPSEPSAPSAGRSGFSAPDDEGGRQLHLLARVTTELGAAQAMDDVVEAAVEHAASALGAAVTTLMLRIGDDLHLVGSHGIDREIVERFRAFGVDEDTPAGEAVRSGRPVVHPADVGRQYTALRDVAPPERSVVCLPMGAEAPVGVLGLTFDQNWLPGERELDFLTTFAEACGQAVRRVTAAAEAAERRRQLEFLARASAELAGSLDDEATLASVARLAVPELADWCSVEVLEGDHIRTVAIAHVDPEKVAWAWAFRRRYPPAPDAPHGIGAAIRTGRSQLVPTVPEGLLAELARDPEHLRQSRQLGLRSAMVVPLVAPGGRVLGAMNLSRSEDPRPYSEADLALAEDLGRRAALAVENAQLHQHTQDTAEQLQRAVLPAALDDLPGWEIGTHYEPGGPSGVGGDFYGATALPDGRLAVFIGDVMGHGVPAAAAMAQLRSAVRAFLTVDPDPVVVIRRVQEMFEQVEVTPLATLCYALVDPASGRVDLVNAGHLAPMLVRADGTVDVACTPVCPVLGAPTTTPVAGSLALDPDDVLVLFTDGLVERRYEVIDDGLRRLRDAAGVLATAELSGALGEVVADVRGTDVDDDIAVIAVRARR